MSLLNGEVPVEPQPIGQIAIQLMSDGSIRCQCKVPGGRTTVLGMIEGAKADLVEHAKNAPKAPSIAIAPPGLRL